MEKTIPIKFKRTFLLMFTKELIKHSIKQDIIKLEKIIETREKQKEIKLGPVNLIVPSPPQQTKLTRGMPIKIPAPKLNAITPTTKQIVNPQEALFIPEPKLPEHLAYLKPIAQKTEIDLWKLNPLIKDPNIKIIEGNPDEEVKVTGTGGTKLTNIILNKEDINRIINRFSEISKIPTAEGVYKVVVGDLILSAIISEVVGSRFIIKKIAYPTRQQYGRIPPQRRMPQQPPIIPQRPPFLGRR